MSLLRRIQSLFSPTPTEQPPAQEQDPAQITDPCCGPIVHIAYRGKADDRMYMTYNRTWQEVRYYQPNGLRVFCATCRRRVY